jgi:tetratricopeptide (TPR) repeat protein
VLSFPLALVDEDGYVRDDLTGLGPDGFEQLCRALAIRVLGAGITAFGSGRDGGREASFSGRQQYPNLADPWDGYGVVQAKYKDQLLGATADTTWLRGQVKAELDDWADPSKRRVRDGRRPEYLVLATNVPLSSVPGSGGKDRTDELIRGYSAVLGLRDWRVWDGNQIRAFLNAYPDVKRPFAALTTPGDVLADQLTMLGVALETRATDDAAGRLARLRERVGTLPAAARPGLEDALDENPAAAEQLVSAVTDPSARPAETVAAWVQDPPAFLGTPDAPVLHGIWTVIGEIAAAYGLHDYACTAFQRAVAAGSARRAYMLARAGWAAVQADNLTGASSLVAGPRSPRSPEAAFDVVTAFVRLTANALRSDPGSGSAMFGSSAASAAPEPVSDTDQQLRDSLRRQLAEWDPQGPADRDMRARIGAQIELTDPARSTAARCNAALQILDGALARGWLDDTALAAATALRWRATTGAAADRSGDLHRSVQLALRVRDEYRRARRDSAQAVRMAVAAANEAGRYRQVITIGSAKYGEAAPEEAADPQVAEQVVLAAAKGIPHIADELAADPGQLPDGFVRAWAQALLAMRGGLSGDVSREERIVLWQQALAAATNDDERREALQGLAAAGADDLPELDELLGEDPATAAEWHARAALARDDPERAVSLMHPHRDTSPSAAGLLGEAYAALGETDAAVDTLTTAASRFDHDDLIIQAAGICALAGDTAREEGLLTDVLRTAAATWAGRGRARTLLGELQADRGAWPDAIASWDSALEEDPYLDSARWQLTYALAARGEHARAWAVLTAAPAASGDILIPDNPPTANAAHLALVLIRRNSDSITLVTHGLQYLKLFGGDERFAGHTLALLSAPRTQEDAPDQAVLDPALRAELEQALDAFFTTYPDSQYLRRRSSSDLADLVGHLNQDARPSPEMAAQARKSMLAVMRGRQPLGVLVPLSRRPYAHCAVTFAAGVLTAVDDSDEHLAGVADACAALGIQPLTSPPGSGISPGGPTTQRQHARGSSLRATAITPTAAVVTDTTALYVRTLLPHLAGVLAGGVREMLLTEHAYTDIIAARDEILLPTAGTWVVDPETGQGHLVPLDPAMRSLHRSAIDAVFTLAGDCRRLAVPATGSHDLDTLAGPEFDPWAGGLRLASARGSALWADDIALRRLARGAGIPAFSTLALLDAYGQIGLISAEQREQAVRRLICGYVGDFPPDDGRLRALAACDSNSRGAVCSAMAKPAFWSSPPSAISLYGGLSSDLNASSPEIVADLLNVSILGITRTEFAPPLIEDLCARLAAATINMTGPLGDVPRLLQALRVALKDTDPPIPDILPVIVGHLMSAFQMALTARGAPDASLAADNVRALFARCAPDDQSTVRRAILSSR